MGAGAAAPWCGRIGGAEKRRHLRADVHDPVEDQLGAIVECLAAARELCIPVWLRGGWAVDFVLGRVTRGYAHIDWFAPEPEGSKLRDRLIERSFKDVFAGKVVQAERADRASLTIRVSSSSSRRAAVR